MDQPARRVAYGSLNSECRCLKLVDTFREWDGDWSRYTTNDLDFFVNVPAFGGIFFAAFSLDSPEVITIPALPFDLPIEIIVSGFEVNSGTDNWRLRITVDGTLVTIP